MSASAGFDAMQKRSGVFVRMNSTCLYIIDSLLNLRPQCFGVRFPWFARLPQSRHRIRDRGIGRRINPLGDKGVDEALQVVGEGQVHVLTQDSLPYLHR